MTSCCPSPLGLLHCSAARVTGFGGSGGGRVTRGGEVLGGLVVSLSLFPSKLCRSPVAQSGHGASSLSLSVLTCEVRVPGLQGGLKLVNSSWHMEGPQ